MYPPDSPYTVYEHSYWWSDKWDALDYGQDYNFNEPFFQQFHKLMLEVPRLSINTVGCENSSFVNLCGYSKNCYLSFNTDYSENCYYCHNVTKSKDSLDLLNADSSELCCNSIDINKCYNLIYSSNCKNSNDLIFCSDCIGCSNCFGSVNLRNKKFYFYNKPYSKTEYEKLINNINLGSYNNFLRERNKFYNHKINYIHKATKKINCEDCIGDYLTNCKDTQICFDCFNDESIKYCTITSDCKDTYDFDVGGYNCSFAYEMISSGDRNYMNIFGTNHWGNCRETIYCDIMIRSKNCFGCIGLDGKQYCILNKQYTKEEYERLVPRIIKHMKSNKEWGEFFPISISPFAYNETDSYEFHPITKNEIFAKNYKWKEKDEREYQKQTYQIPDDIKNVQNNICDEILACEITGKNYKIIPQELKYYRERGLPIPRKCPDQRHKERMALRNPRKLWDRKCDKCKKEIKTTYSPDRPEIVYCEKCYLNEVY